MIYQNRIRHSFKSQKSFMIDFVLICVNFPFNIENIIFYCVAKPSFENIYH